MALLFGVFRILAVAGFALWIWASVNSLSKPDAVWEAAGQNKIVWLLVIIFLGFIGAILYALIAKPQLDQHTPTL